MKEGFQLLAIVGMTGSGKSSACDVLKEQGWTSIRFGQVTIDKLIESRVPVTPENEKQMREKLRAEMGMGAYAMILLPRIKSALQKGSVVLDGLYSWSEYKILKDRFPDRFKVVHVYSPPAIRYRRLAKRSETEKDPARTVRTLTEESARKRDYAEIEEIEKGGPIAMADFIIDNQTGLDDLARRVLEIAMIESLEQ